MRISITNLHSPHLICRIPERAAEFSEQERYPESGSHPEHQQFVGKQFDYFLVERCGSWHITHLGPNCTKCTPASYSRCHVAPDGSRGC
jgi:hypothetical protein